MIPLLASLRCWISGHHFHGLHAARGAWLCCRCGKLRA